ncbi:hypothetical protein [Paenibacillus sp. UNC499MF]|uniref:hypothetical protein n=1 Tax=Paenibacillus sp. UNC499MF TaxID=1502751 RepID=UPI00089FF226|nr:hypothetical protein [Paenibacillus sp. UNC499MF]SEF68969.1 hypothetical protein SAMN02799616_00885 [Paenibacillus sp. UNC499MF]
MAKHWKKHKHEKKHTKVKVTKVKKSRNTVIVKQAAKARTGQGGNAFAINASDVGVVKTNVGRR